MGRVEKYIETSLRKYKKLHATLIDPANTDGDSAARLAHQAEKAGSTLVLLGGSTISSSEDIDHIAKVVKKSVKIPVVLFPGNITGVSRFADAIFYMSLLNSTNPYFIIGAQILAAPLIKRYNLEAVPLGYIILGEGGSAGIMGQARALPYSKPELIAMHALAAEYLGMRFVYLEAGSGAEEPVPPYVVAMVRKAVNIHVIVGGGIREPRDAKRLWEAGAEILVTGNLTENTNTAEKKLTNMIAQARQ